MKSFSNETTSELLTQLMDNELEAAKESILYDALGSSVDLQEEHKIHIAVREAVKQDTEAFTPPVATVSSLFNKLGYVPPPPAANYGIIRKSPFALSFLRKAAIPVLILLIGSYAGYTIFDKYDNELITNETSISEVVATNNEISLANQDESITAINDVAEPTKLNNGVIRAAKTPIMSSSIVLSDNKDVDSQIESKSFADNNLYSVNNGYPEQQVIATQTSFVLNNPEIRFNTKQFTPAGSIAANNLNLSGLGDNSLGLTVYARGMNSFNADLGNVFSAMNSTPGNLSLGVIFGNKSLKGGLEGGQQFYSILSTDLNNESVLVDQIRAVNWVAATGKYDFDNLSYLNTHPFAQLSIGFANFGQYMYRYSAGLEFRPYESRFGIIAGYEASSLFYTIQSQSQNATANGWFVGFSIGL